MLAQAVSASLRGIDGQRVVVEVHVGNGLPAFHVVGLPDASCREARDRVRAAIVSSGFKWPSARITVNLAPSGVRKEGAGFDLAIALAILAAGTDIFDRTPLDGMGFVGELGLDGSLRPVPGTLSLVAAMQVDTAIVASAAAHEAELVDGVKVRGCESLGQVVACLTDVAPWPDPQPPSPVGAAPLPDLADVSGHPFARRALEVAAAGGHNLLMVGPPGTGKSMLARRLPGILPDLDPDTALVTSRIHSVAGLPLPHGRLLSTPPFRAPHHSASMAAMVGGGSARLRPGEASCAHGGVLFLDELGEFSPRTLDALRQPIEEGVVRISRAQGTVAFPASICLVAAMNPCPCGLLGSAEPCRCSDAARQRYARRLSGPLLDRIDVRVHVERPAVGELLARARGEGSAAVRERVVRARDRAHVRGVAANAQLPVDCLDEVAPLDGQGRRLVEAALRDGRLSARGLTRVRRVARTIADLEAKPDVDADSVAVALAMRARPALLDACGAFGG
ncbi:MAG: YifB family Mg chelatase-like AAA ATPase [Actinomycetota bacterium]